MITSLKPSTDGRAMILRLYNTGDLAAKAKLKWGTISPKSITVSGLLEETGAPAGDTVDLSAYEVRTLRGELE